MHQEFIRAAGRLGIPTVFTTHDFFGLYPMNAVYPMEHNLTDYECSIINSNAPTMQYLKVMQSPLVRYVKSSKFLRYSLNKLKCFKVNKRKANTQSIDVKPYHVFRQYIVNILDQIDYILYNSTVSKDAYERYCHPRNSKILHVTHSKLPQRREFIHNSGKLNIAYLGGTRPYKGLDFLLQTFNQLSKITDRYHLNIFGVNGDNTESVTYHAKFNDFEVAMKNMDAIVVPSLTYESFGFVVLEALFYGMPAIVSDVVGAKDLLAEHHEYIFKAGDACDLIYKLKSLMYQYNLVAINPAEFAMDKHCQDMNHVYQICIDRKKNNEI
ncbi:chloramphenicol acetyltransferase [Bifidobacterium pullorum subsp. saeculare DSM 6531 = LMG 14934]|uniref:Chloramphenicol acetyltransferase n=1 Tax=Bifidobacterium pullorum subsp. saeculare DSM 6531 = LMG 14934 TaxID=1437611 RepID=A0A087CPG5_9BIFI|nr:chloramphenicol acetyltransferase [Bifidobacterium pullorum subsp. saeculare DSM 6531 = LMG 14934]